MLRALSNLSVTVPRDEAIFPWEGWRSKKGIPIWRASRLEQRLILLSPLLAGELPEALAWQILQVRRVAEEELPAAAAGRTQHPAGPPVPVAGGGAAGGRGSQGAAPSPHLPAQPEALSSTSLPGNSWPPEMNPDQLSRFLISWGRAGGLVIPAPPSPSIPGAAKPRSGAMGHPHAAPAPTKQLTQQGGDGGGGGGEWHRSHGIFLLGWGGGLFCFPHLFRSPAPPVFPNLYLQRDSLALELFCCRVLRDIPGANARRQKIEQEEKRI